MNAVEVLKERQDLQDIFTTALSISYQVNYFTMG